MTNNDEKKTKTDVNTELQMSLADKYHTCLCGGDREDDRLQDWNGWFKPGTTKLLFANLSDGTRPAPKGRMVFYKTKCGKCGNVIIHGESAASYNSTGRLLLTQVAAVVARRLGVDMTRALELLKPSIRKYRFKTEIETTGV